MTRRISDPLIDAAAPPEANVEKLLELPVTKKEQTKLVFAMVEGWTQDAPVMDPDHIIVAAVQDGLVFIAEAPLAERFGVLEPCAALMGDETPDDFRQCFSENASEHPAYSAAQKQAQAMYDRLPLR